MEAKGYFINPECLGRGYVCVVGVAFLNHVPLKALYRDISQ